jgi:hypothetical protein
MPETGDYAKRLLRKPPKTADKLLHKGVETKNR